MMSSGHDFEAPEAADVVSPSATSTDLEFIGPLRSADQAWTEHTVRADSSAALFEPADNVIRRREAHIASLYRVAALLTLSGDLAGGRTAGFRAVAESRALAEFLAASPSYCLDCFLLGDRCQRHQAVESAEQPASGAESTSGRLPDARSSGARSSAPGSVGTGSVDDRPASRASGGSGAGSGGARPAPGHQPEWRRFGADEFPSASG